MDRLNKAINETLALLAEREQWEADQTAVAEYEAWYLQKVLAEADADHLAEQ